MTSSPLGRKLILTIIGLITLCFISCEGKYHSGPEYERNKDQTIDDFGQKVEKKYNMELISVICVIEGASERYAMSFISNKKISLEEGRSTGLSLFDEFLEMLQKDDKVKTYVEESLKGGTKRPVKPSGETISLKITYWDENVDRRFPPYLAAIIFSEERFNYYEANPKTQELRLVLSESYEDAMANLS